MNTTSGKKPSVDGGNIVLIGMPGAGKSTVGVVLAKRLGYGFVDSDLLIQEREGKLLYEIMEEQGIDGFVRIENEVNASIRAARAVIATGGSAVYGAQAMEHLRKTGLVVYLALPCEELAERLGDLNERGVAIREGQTLAQLFAERAPLYERYADVVVDCHGRPIRQIVDKIARIYYNERAEVRHMDLDAGIRSEIVDLAKKCGIRRVVLFGSRARGDNGDRSDIDLAVSGGDITRFRLDIDDEVRTLLMFDVVNLDGPLQPSLLESIVQEGIVLYEKI